MGRLGWAIILGCLLGAISLGMLQRGCSVDAEPRTVVLPQEPSEFDRELQQSVAAAPAGSARSTAPPPTPPRTRPTVTRPNQRAGVPLQRTNPGETAEEAEARRDAMRADRQRQLEEMRRNLRGANGVSRRTIPANTTPQAASGGAAPEPVFVQDDAVPLFDAPAPPRSQNAGLGPSSVALRPSSASAGSRGESGGAEAVPDSTPLTGSESLSPNPSGFGGGGSFTTVGGGIATGGNNGGNNGGGNGGGNNGGGETPTPPGAFALSTPANSATKIALAPTLSWQAAPGAATYVVRVAEDSGFGSVVVQSAPVAGTTFAVPAGQLEPGTQYFWRVAATNTVGSVDANSTFAFTTAALPGAFTIEAPAPGGPAIRLPVTLSWASSQDADAYLLTVARDSEFADVVLVQPNLTETSFAVPEDALEEGAAYFWRVVATNSVGVATASPATASFRVLGAPGPFSLVSPTNAAASQFIPLPLAWTPAVDAASYRVEVATDEAFTNRVVNVANVTAPAFLLTSSHISPGQTYFWRVTATNEVDDRASTPDVFSFSTMPGPGEFALVAPADGGVGTRPVTLQWQESAGALLYTVELSSNASFTSIIATQLVVPLIDGTSWTIPGNLLALNNTYFWRVTAENIIGTRRAIVSPFSFTVREADYDVNQDGTVDVRDLYAFHAIPNPKPDLNLDGLVDDNDRLGLRGAIRQDEPEDVAGQ